MKFFKDYFSDSFGRDGKINYLKLSFELVMLPFILALKLFFEVWVMTVMPFVLLVGGILGEDITIILFGLVIFLSLPDGLTTQPGSNKRAGSLNQFLGRRGYSLFCI